jgi:hypothetical protein
MNDTITGMVAFRILFSPKFWHVGKKQERSADEKLVLVDVQGRKVVVVVFVIVHGGAELESIL